MFKMILQLHVAASLLVIVAIVLASLPLPGVVVEKVLVYGFSAIAIIGVSIFMYRIYRGIQRALFGPIQVEVVKRRK